MGTRAPWHTHEPWVSKHSPVTGLEHSPFPLHGYTSAKHLGSCDSTDSAGVGVGATFDGALSVSTRGLFTSGSPVLPPPVDSAGQYGSGPLMTTPCVMIVFCVTRDLFTAIMPPHCTEHVSPQNKRWPLLFRRQKHVVPVPLFDVELSVAHVPLTRLLHTQYLPHPTPE